MSGKTFGHNENTSIDGAFKLHFVFYSSRTTGVKSDAYAKVEMISRMREIHKSGSVRGGEVPKLKLHREAGGTREP